MRLSPARVEQTLSQFEAQPIPENHPVLAQLKDLFGDHTFFLDTTGLNIVEPFDRRDAGGAAGQVINLANWTDDSATRLEPHEPKATDVVVEFAPEEGLERLQ